MPQRANYALYWPPVGLVLLAAALRLPWLGAQSIAFDESFSLAVARADWPLLFEATLSDGVHPPLFYILHKANLALFGGSEFGQRFGAAGFSLLGVALLFWAGRCLFSRQVGLWAALLLALNPVHIWLAQEARMYSPLAALVISSMVVFWQALRFGRRQHWVGLAVINALIFGLHYFGFLVPVIQFGYILTTFRRHHHQLRLWVMAQGTALLPLLPWLAATATREAQTFGIGFLQKPALVDLPVTFWNLVTGATGRGWPIGVILAVGSAVALAAALRPPRCRAAWLLVLWWAMAPPLLTWLISQRRSFYADRYLALAIPALMLLLAVAVHRRRFWAVALTALLMAGVLVTRLDPAFQKDDWRAAAAYISSQSQSGDVILLYSTHISLVFNYYYRGQVPVKPISLNLEHFDLESLTAQANRAWMVYPYTRRPTHYPMQPLLPHGYWSTDPTRNPRLVQWFEAHAGGVADYRHFRGVEVWLVDLTDH
jgi:uncharacterized membrane protein